MSVAEDRVARARLLRHPAVPVWAVLVSVTGLSWWLSGHRAHADAGHKLAFVFVLALAFVKVLLVGEYFMELRHAPTPLRLIFIGWAVSTCVAVVGLYLRV